MSSKKILTKGHAGNTYYNQGALINVTLSSIITLMNYFNEKMFPNETNDNRVVYASNDYAFRKRLQTNKAEDTSGIQVQNLNFPFMNMSLSDVDTNVSRPWKSAPQEIYGMMDWDIGKKIKISPLHLSFEATFYTENEFDTYFAMSEFMWDDALETKIYPPLEIDGQPFNNIGVLGYNLNFNPQYQESDWLNQNNIRTISMDFELDTYLVQTTTEGFWVPKEVLVTFATTQNIDIHDWDDYDLLLTGVIDHLEKEVVF